MNLREALLARRRSRLVLIIVALAALAFLVVGNSLWVRVAVALMVLLVLILLKVVAEIHLDGKRMEHEQSLERAKLGATLDDHRRDIEDVRMSLDRMAGEVADASRRADADRAGVQRQFAEVSQRVASLEQWVASQATPRRHVVHADAKLRELGLSQSMDSVAPRRAVDLTDPDQVLGSNDPGAGGSMSSNG